MTRTGTRFITLSYFCPACQWTARIRMSVPAGKEHHAGFRTVILRPNECLRCAAVAELLACDCGDCDLRGLVKDKAERQSEAVVNAHRDAFGFVPVAPRDARAVSVVVRHGGEPGPRGLDFDRAATDEAPEDEADHAVTGQ